MRRIIYEKELRVGINFFLMRYLTRVKSLNFFLITVSPFVPQTLVPVILFKINSKVFSSSYRIVLKLCKL